MVDRRYETTANVALERRGQMTDAECDILCEASGRAGHSMWHHKRRRVVQLLAASIGCRSCKSDGDVQIALLRGRRKHRSAAGHHATGGCGRWRTRGEIDGC